jgi:hypothetical protein
MRDRSALTIFMKLLFTLECIALLAPVTLFWMIPVVVALGELILEPELMYGDRGFRLQILGLLLVSVVFGAIALVEVTRIVTVTLHEIALPWNKRTVFSVVSGVIATISVGFLLYLGEEQAPLEKVIHALVLVGPALLLCGHLWWLQVWLGRRAAAA